MTLPDRPVLGEDIDVAWGQAVHDRVFASFGFRVHGGTITVNDGSDQTLPIDVADDDPGGWMDAPLNAVECPTGRGGLYLLIAEYAAINGAVDSETRGSIYVNGTKVASALEQNEGGVASAWTCVVLFDVVAGDRFTCGARLRHDSGTNPDVTLTSFSGIFITDARGA